MELIPDFETVWLRGPWRKLGKDRAQKHWNSQVRTLAAYESFCGAEMQYRHDLRANPWKTPMHGSTWFCAAWRDYVPTEAFAELLKDAEEIKAAKV